MLTKVKEYKNLAGEVYAVALLYTPDSNEGVAVRMDVRLPSREVSWSDSWDGAIDAVPGIEFKSCGRRECGIGHTMFTGEIPAQ